MLQNDAARTAGMWPTIRAERGANRQTPATEVIQARLYATLP
ncbi:hypothetical protein ONO23_02789 [Micromonospora noduli]|nr:hypothetical protein ONO23_02789 [Micromonospora noduli]